MAKAHYRNLRDYSHEGNNLVCGKFAATNLINRVDPEDAIFVLAIGNTAYPDLEALCTKYIIAVRWQEVHGEPITPCERCVALIDLALLDLALEDPK